MWLQGCEMGYNYRNCASCVIRQFRLNNLVIKKSLRTFHHFRELHSYDVDRISPSLD